MHILKLIGTAAATLLFGLILLPQAFAQESATVEVSGTVIQGLSIEAEQNLFFGDIVAGETKRVNLDGTGTGSSPGDEQAGVFRISTLGSFTVSFTEVPSFMTGSGENNEGVEMPVLFFSAWNNSDTPPDEENEVSLSDDTAINLEITGDEQDVFVFLGAEVEPPVTQAEGLYETTIILTATFGID